MNPIVVTTYLKKYTSAVEPDTDDVIRLEDVPKLKDSHGECKFEEEHSRGECYGALRTCQDAEEKEEMKQGDGNTNGCFVCHCNDLTCQPTTCKNKVHHQPTGKYAIIPWAHEGPNPEPTPWDSPDLDKISGCHDSTEDPTAELRDQVKDNSKLEDNYYAYSNTKEQVSKRRKRFTSKDDEEVKLCKCKMPQP